MNRCPHPESLSHHAARLYRLRWRWLAVGLLSLLLLPAASLPAAPKIGVFPFINDGGAKAYVDNYETWLGRPVDYILQFPPGNTWGHIVGNNGGGLAWWINEWASCPQSYRDRMIISLCMLPGDGSGNHADGANGDYNVYWEEVAEKLVAAGYGNCIIRPGWEFTGNWYAWAVFSGDEADFRNHWIQLVTTMQSVSGANFKFLWNPTNGYVGYNPWDCFPGAQYVDYIGIDVYDTSGYYNDPDYPDNMAQWEIDNRRQNAWLNKTEWGAYNLNWWSAQAASVGVPLCFPEWGCDDPANPQDQGYGGKDDPDFIQRMYDFMIDPANHVAWHSYFEWGDGDDLRNHALCFSNQYPDAAAGFLELFGPVEGDLFLDTFDTGTAGNWSEGTSSPWSVVADNGDNAYNCAFGWYTYPTNSAGASWSNYLLELDVKITQMQSWSYTYIFANYTDDNNRYQLSLEKTNPDTRVRLLKTSGGTTTVLGSVNTTLNTGSWYTVSLLSNDGHLVAKLNGSSLIDVQDGTPLSSGKIGLSTQKQGATFDNIAVTSLGGAASQGIYQAEDFTAQSGCAIDTAYGGYTGSGYVGYGGSGTYVEWNHVNEGAGSKTLVIRFSNGGSTNRNCQIQINGVNVASLAFAPTGSWTTWSNAYKSVSLNAGDNTIRITATTSNGGPNIDKMEVQTE